MYIVGSMLLDKLLCMDLDIRIENDGFTYLEIVQRMKWRSLIVIVKRFLFLLNIWRVFEVWLVGVLKEIKELKISLFLIKCVVVYK